MAYVENQLRLTVFGKFQHEFQTLVVVVADKMTMMRIICKSNYKADDITVSKMEGAHSISIKIYVQQSIF